MTEIDEGVRFCRRFMELTRPHYAETFAADMAEWKAKWTVSEQRGGIKAALADVAEMSHGMSREDFHRINAALSAEGLMTLLELQLIHGKRVKRLLKSKRLKREDDAIALKGMLNSNLLTPEESLIAENLIGFFQI